MSILGKVIKFGVPVVVGVGAGFVTASALAGQRILELEDANLEYKNKLDSYNSTRRRLLCAYVSKRIDDYQKSNNLNWAQLVKALRIPPQKLSAYRSEKELPNKADLVKLNNILGLNLNI